VVLGRGVVSYERGTPVRRAAPLPERSVGQRAPPGVGVGLLITARMLTAYSAKQPEKERVVGDARARTFGTKRAEPSFAAHCVERG